MPGDRLLTELTACPRCDKSPLAESGHGHRCPSCKTAFPSIAGIPWLFADPDASLGEWRNRMHFALQASASDAQRLRAELDDGDLPALTRRRLEHHANALDTHRGRLRELLAPLDVHASPASLESYLAMRTRLPTDQGISTYYANVHRDWCWGDEENEASLAAVRAVAGDRKFGRTLVLGAGAGRLAYDLHMTADPELTVAMDFNPLLVLIAARVVAGESLPMHEFPLAPLAIEDVAVERTLAAPEAVRQGFELVLADALRPPFRDAAFDTVVTPWIIDIVNEPLATQAARINGLLAPGGCWINFGSLSFDAAAEKSRLSREETLDVVAAHGFEVARNEDRRIPYLCSPSSRHGRAETTFAFAAVKRNATRRPPRHRALPDWIVTGKEPVPALTAFRSQAATTQIHSYIMSMIDGRRTLEDMAAILDQQKLMSRAEAVPALRNFLARMYEDAERGRRR